MLLQISSPCQLLDEAQVDKLADDAYVFAARYDKVYIMVELLHLQLWLQNGGSIVYPYRL